ncbi:MAG: tetratricopeptide repeat protein [Pikeienuella sp.]|uniref:tetratricopeptide repeat protein n=1 Tax=Pikeienuella sp. TaxID=2831957 RepID=UPI00391A18D1
MTMIARAASLALLAAATGAPLAASGQESFAGSYLAGAQAAKRGDVEAAARYFSRALDRSPGDLALGEQTLLYLTAAGRMEQAEALAERMIVFDPTQRLASLVLVTAEMRGGENEAAARRIEAAPAAFHPLLRDLLSTWVKAAGGDEEGARAMLDSVEGPPVFRVFAAYHLALLSLSSGDATGAAEAFGRLSEDMPRLGGRMARAEAAALFGVGNADEAREKLEAAASRVLGDAAIEADLAFMEKGEAPPLLVRTASEGAAEAFYGLAAALGQEPDDRLSLVYARLASWLRPDLDEAKLLVAEVMEGTEQFEAAVRAYETIPPDSPYARAAEIGRAEALFRMDRADEAAEALKALTRRAPDALEAHIALGDILRRTERFREAAAAYDAATNIAESAGRANWALYYQRAISYERSQQWEKAEADFFKALELEPDQPLVLNYLGYSWLERRERLDEAMDMIRKAVAARPEDGYIVDSLGWGFFLLEDYPAAVRELQRAVELRPVDPVINDHFGDALWMVGRKREAEFQWRRALSFDPEEKDRERIRRKLDVGLDVVRAEEVAAEAAPETPRAADGG